MRPTSIIDLDLHQGDGNASIFDGVDDVFTCSIHEEALFPIPKMRSDLDVGFRSGAGDTEGLLERDRRVASFAASRRCGLVVLPAGGYTNESPAITAAGLAAIAELDPTRHA